MNLMFLYDIDQEKASITDASFPSQKLIDSICAFFESKMHKYCLCVDIDILLGSGIMVSGRLYTYCQIDFILRQLNSQSL